MSRRVAITGIGVCAANGASREAFWEACLAGRAVVEPIPERWRRFADFASGLWAPLPAREELLAGFGRVERAQNDPVSLLALGAAREALEQAGFELELRDRRAGIAAVEGLSGGRTGVWMGTGIGGAHSFLGNHTVHLLERPRRALAERAGSAEGIDEVLADLAHGPRFNPFVVSMLMPNAVSAILGIRLSLRGPNLTVALACASGTAALGEAYRAVRAGAVDAALAGGAEYLDDEHGGIFRGFDIARVLVRDCAEPARANRPFDRRRSGFLYSQGGAAVLVLEELEAARRRGARPIAELVGYGESFDAHSVMAIEPDARAAERAVRAALAEAGAAPGEVDYVNAHGTGTVANDQAEAALIERIFGRAVAVNSTKALIGHAIGAAGAIEAAVAALSLRDQRTHPCVNLEEPIAALDFVRDAGPRELRLALSQSFGFGGHNAAVLLRRVE